MIIRPAILDDSRAVLALRNLPESVFWSGKSSISETTHHEWFPNHFKSILVLSDEAGGICGYARVSEDGRVSFVVGADYAGKGYGRQLLHALEEMADEAGIRVLWADVHPSNVASIRAFMHAGYVLDFRYLDFTRKREGYQRVRKNVVG